MVPECECLILSEESGKAGTHSLPDLLQQTISAPASRRTEPLRAAAHKDRNGLCLPVILQVQEILRNMFGAEQFRRFLEEQRGPRISDKSLLVSRSGCGFAIALTFPFVMGHPANFFRMRLHNRSFSSVRGLYPLKAVRERKGPLRISSYGVSECGRRAFTRSNRSRIMGNSSGLSLKSGSGYYT